MDRLLRTSSWRQRFMAGIIVLMCGSASMLVLSAVSAGTYATQSEAEAGVIGGTAAVREDISASGRQAVLFGISNSSNQDRLGALDSSASNAELYAAGFRRTIVAVAWDRIEPSKGQFSASALAEAQSKIDNAKQSGLKVSLDIGVQYAPSWVFDEPGGTRFVSQYGDVFGGSAGSGDNVPNAVTNDNVRQAMSNYLARLGQLANIDTVRLGGAAYNELRYPSGGSGSQPNAYWFYDASSQARLPTNVRGWKPGSGSTAQAQAFLAAYHGAMTDYGVWLTQAGRASFSDAVKIELLMPGWGVRPGQVSSAVSQLLNGTPDEINQGLDWAAMLPRLPADGRVIAYSTYADATQGSTDNPNPAEYIHSILPIGVLQGGESTGNGQTTDAGMRLMFANAKRWNWYSVNWYFNGQPQSPAQVGSVYSAS